ncbi:MAG TPA: VWA domain-containing protein [Anaerolineae bacterium]|nr:VWA domain-containing protein [Anaerolineae bacterium]HQK15056.1 VWA domain-containing protein [Anaerolineae bacterium]
MRKMILALLLSVLLLNAASITVLADGMIFPESTSPDYLEVRYHRVTVTIEDNHAITRVEQEFVNPHDFPVDGRYFFPVPPDAILARFEARVGGQVQTVTRQDVATTNAALYDMVAQRRDPSLLQYADWESIAFDLSLPARASRKMTLEYEQVLAPTGGMLHYRYILSTEKYVSAPLAEVTLTVDVTTSGGLGALYSSSHAVTTERLGANRARVTWEAQNVNPTEDFDLFFSPAEGGFGSGLLTGTRADRSHFLFLFAPDDAAMQNDTLPKDIIFVIDRSGSMNGEKIEQAKDALQFILGQLNPNDRFSIVSFDDQLDIFADTLTPVDQHALSDARRFVQRLAARSSTDIEGALQAGLAIFSRSEDRAEASRLLVFLTDGLPTAGVTDDVMIARLVQRANARVEARLHMFGVGYDVNTHLLDRLALDNDGSVTYVQPGENLEVVLSEFYGRIANPVLTDVEIEFEGMRVTDLYPPTMPDLFRGSSVLLAGRYKATDEQVTVRVRGRAGEEQREYVYRYDLAETGNHDFVTRLWATRRVGALLDEVRVKGEKAALIEEIRELGLSYGIVTPYTTFVISAQAEGAASMENMALYGNQTELNQVSGRTTIQARVQNQSYQQTNQANLAVGANVINREQRSMAQVARQYVDLSLVQAQGKVDEPITEAWIAANIKVDREIEFGSGEYFALANDPAARTFLQSGTNVLFSYNGEVVAVRDPQSADPQSTGDVPPQAADSQPVQARQDGALSRLFELLKWLWQIIFAGRR